MHARAQKLWNSLTENFQALGRIAVAARLARATISAIACILQDKSGVQPKDEETRRGGKVGARLERAATDA